jgi:trehalose 6-phosphate phosphatase
LKYLFAEWGKVADRLREAKHILLFSDFDGTLAPIVERPELAKPSENVRELLRALTRQRRFTVGIVSGRALKDLKSRVGITGIIYAGNHGLEIEGPGLSFIHPLAEELSPVLHLISQVLGKALKPLAGVFIEDKGLSLSVHFRQVEDAKEKDVKNIFESVVHVARSLGKIRVTTGKKVYEVRPPVAWDKGKAISMLLARYNKTDDWATLPIFLGDDLTDEDGFKVIEKHSGISIFVGEAEQDSVAHYFLRSPSETEEFLSILLNKPKGDYP